MTVPASTPDYAHRLQVYAVNVIKNDFGQEFDNALYEWQKWGNDLVGYAIDALKIHTKYLEGVKQDQERNGQLAMMALSMLAGPALSFISGTLQYRVAQRLWGQGNNVVKTVPNPNYKPPSAPPPKPKAPLPPPFPKPRPKIGKDPPQKYNFSDEKAKVSRNVRGFKEQNDEIAKAKKSITPGDPSIDTLTKEFTTEVIDPRWSKVKGKIIGDLAVNVPRDFARHFLVNPTVNVELPSNTDLINTVNNVPDSADLTKLQLNLEKAWQAARNHAKNQVLAFANSIDKDWRWGDEKWEMLRKENSSVQDPYQLLHKGELLVDTLVNDQRRRWAKEDAWKYFATEPIRIPEARCVNAIETELWALWVRTEWFHYQKYRAIANRAKLSERLTSKHGINPNKILPRLLQLGVVASSVDVENARRHKYGDPALMPVEINSIDGDIDTHEELDALNNWARKRQPTLFGSSLGSKTRDIGNLVIKTLK